MLDDRTAPPTASNPRGVVFAVVPVFNRWQHTSACISALRNQSYPSIHIIISDGGSQDGTRENLIRDYPDVTLIAPEKEQWWTGSTALGIDHALAQGSDESFVLLINNDTIVPRDYVEKLVNCSMVHRAAVCGRIVDSSDPSRVLDAGEFIEWERYAFPVRTETPAGVTFLGDVDVLPGRGSLIPLWMIRKCGNVDAIKFPHYLADYEFFCRLKKEGFTLGICCETEILAHIEETGLVATTGISTVAAVWAELFSRRSMSNVIDHGRFIARHAPQGLRLRLLWRLTFNAMLQLGERTWIRFLYRPLIKAYRIVKFPFRILSWVKRAWHDPDELWKLNSLPFPFRSAVALILLPRPFQREELVNAGLDPDALCRAGIIKHAAIPEWFMFKTMNPDKPVQCALDKFLSRCRACTFDKLRIILQYRRHLLYKAK